MRKRNVTILVVVLSMLSLGLPNAYAAVVFDDGGTHYWELEWTTGADFSVDYEAPGMQTTFNIRGGRIMGVSAYENGRVNVSAGQIELDLHANGSSQITLSGGEIRRDLYASDSSKVTISGGQIGWDLCALNSSEVTVSRGMIGGQIFAGYEGSHVDESVITFVGTDFAINGQSVGYGQYFASDYASGHLTGMLANGTLLDNDFYIYDNASIVLATEPGMPPVADAGVDQTVFVGTDCLAQVSLNGSDSNDPDGGELIYKWSLGGQEIATGVNPTVKLPLGVHTIELVVNDGIEDSEPDEVVITVLDNTPPEITLNGADTLVLECGVDSYIEEGAAGRDICDGNIPVVIGGNMVDTSTCGTYIVTYNATDDSGNATQATRIVDVVDTTPPKFVLSVTPDVLWPPNHKMVQISSSKVVSDNCADSPTVTLISIVMNEGEETNTFDPTFDYTSGDGHTIDDIQMINGNIYLRAERSGTGTGRVYTITYQAVDDSNNVTTDSAMVTVPHEQP